MKCKVCGYEGNAGAISYVSSEGWGALRGELPQPVGYVGAVTIDVCPNCGALSSTLNGHVKNPQK